MGIKKTKLSACKPIYWTGINMDIKKHIKSFICLDFQQTQSKEKLNHHEISGKVWKVSGADLFALHNKNYLCIVDHHSIFPVIKMIKDLSADSLILAFRIIFLEYGLPKKIMSDAGANFISDKFKKFCTYLSIKQAVSSSYPH